MPYYPILPKFPSGNLLITDTVLSRGFVYLPFVHRHLSGDWGDVCDYDRACNDQSVHDGTEILSQYSASDASNQKDLITIVTSADRSYTVVFLPGESNG